MTSSFFLSAWRALGGAWRGINFLKRISSWCGTRVQITLVVGTGYYGNMVILEETLECACAHEIEVVAARTEDAVDTFNKLQSDPKKKVVGAFHLTC